MRSGDLFQTTAPYIANQVNCRGKIVGDFTEQVWREFPQAKTAYCQKVRHDGSMALGDAQLVDCGAGKTVINLFAQDDSGSDGRTYTNYAAFRQGLREICRSVRQGSTIAIPHGIGCGLGGGSWELIENIIEEELPNYHVELWKKGG
jgi:O-acetyl-ADP-ribose deacetylase (regulator of RNase III)